MRKAARSTRCRAITRSPRRYAPISFAANIAEDRKGWLFRTARGHKADTLSDRAMNQPDETLHNNASSSWLGRVTGSRRNRPFLAQRNQRNAGITFDAKSSRCVCAQRGGSPGGSVHE